VLRPTFTNVTIDIVTTGDCDISAAQADIVAWINALTPGASLYRDRLKGLCIDNGADTATVNLPAADATVADTEVLRTTSEDVTVA
jgi:hypothetical protein